MSFIAIPEETPGGSLANSSGFWPDIDSSAARSSMRINEMVTQERLEHALALAMAYVNDRLRAFRELQQAAGYTELADVPAEAIDGQSVKILRYKEAVYSWATAYLVEQYATLDVRNAGQTKAEDLLPTPDSYRRDCYWALQDIKSLPRSFVELI